MPPWLIPILMAAMGGAAGQAKGHNTKSTLEGAGLGALLGTGMGGAAGAAGAGGSAAEGASADALAGTTGDALADTASMEGGLSGFGGTAAGSSLDLGSLSAVNPALAGATADGADASMLGMGASQGMGSADLGAIMGGTNPAAAELAPSSFGASPSPAPTAYQSFMSNPMVQKGAGKMNDMGWSAGMQALLSPQTKTSTPGQPLLGQAPAPLQGNPMSMPNYAQQMQMLGFQ